MPDSDELMQTLAFQRGVLTLLKDTGLFNVYIEKAIEDIDLLMEKLPTASSAQSL
jgi:hypothetical protein